MTRAFEHLLQGDIGGAFHFHPLFPIIILIGLAIIFRKNRISKFILSFKGLYSVVALFLVVYGVRMIMLFPTTTPLSFNHNAVLAHLFS